MLIAHIMSENAILTNFYAIEASKCLLIMNQLSKVACRLIGAQLLLVAAAERALAQYARASLTLLLSDCLQVQHQV